MKYGLIAIVALMFAAEVNAAKIVLQVIRKPDGTTYERKIPYDEWQAQKAVQAAQPVVSRAQEWAKREAHMLANGASGHPMGVAPGASFSGTGMTSNPNCPTSQIPSCKPNRPMQLIAEGVVRNNRGAFVSRHWR